MSGQTTYEIYTLANGRWLVDTQFKGTQRDGAIEEAKRIAVQPGIEQVKVVRETFDLNDGLIKESTVFKSELTGDAKSSNTSARGAVFDPYDKVAPSAKPSTGTRRRRAGNRKHSFAAAERLPNRSGRHLRRQSPHPRVLLTRCSLSLC